MAPRPGKSARKICQDAPKYQNRRLDVGTKLVWNRGNVVCARCVARMLLNQARWHLGGGSSSTRTVCNSSASVRLATFFLSFPRPSKYRRFTRRVGLNASEMMDVSAPPPARRRKHWFKTGLDCRSSQIELNTEGASTVVTTTAVCLRSNATDCIITQTNPSLDPVHSSQAPQFLLRVLLRA